MAHYFEIKRNKIGEYVAFFKYNSEVMWWSDGYSSKKSAQSAIQSIMKNGPIASLRDNVSDILKEIARIPGPDPYLIIKNDRNSDNFKSLEKSFNDFSDEIRKTNDLRGLTPDDLDIARQEISEIGSEVKRDKFRAAYFWTMLRSTLLWIAEKSADGVIKALAIALLVAAARVVGIEIPIP